MLVTMSSKNSQPVPLWNSDFERVILKVGKSRAYGVYSYAGSDIVDEVAYTVKLCDLNSNSLDEA